jgi:Leucine-rich repeat (LRR) protein
MPDLPDENANVVFADENIEAAVRESLEQPEGSLTSGDLKKLDELDASEAGIENLFGLEHATNLTELQISPNQISDISPLASLTNLNYLDLAGNPLSQESINTHVPDLRARGVKVSI